jgi:glycosyltransferase involved in cell wall biosynthesis
VIRNKLYYGVKPLVPAFARLGIRRWFAHRQRKQVADSWPILPGSERRPDGWTGWPDGKKFAFVITHDVEGAAGLAKCRRLMELEMKLGFRSSFNFIPEGDYKVTAELREELIRNGFEVGVHDLHHDGKLFRSRESFGHNAARINRYLADWGAVGFRAGFMLRKPDWLTDLEIQYDASTFDTDPFEPQPDGVGTIFPYWKECSNHRGYVELPYTLPQDSTLFVLFGERSPEMWFKKLDWIASNGGMALVNVHPDYMQFEGEPPARRKFPAEFYLRLLEYLREKYGDSVWQVRPKDVAAWYVKTDAAKQDQPFLPALRGTASAGHKPRLRPGRMAVVLYSYYLTDPRPRRETEALVEAGMEADVICLRREGEPAFEVVNGVNIHRVSLSRRRGGKGNYIWRYGFFFLCALWRLTLWAPRRKYQLVHVHNMPDFLVFSAVMPRLLGARVILDLHDPMPELFRGIYGYSTDGAVVRLLSFIEKRSIRFADLVLTPNTAFKDVFAERSIQRDKIEIVMNSPKSTLFNPVQFAVQKNGAPDHPFVMMYHGLLVERHGLDMAIQAVAQLRARIPGLQLHFYGEETGYAVEMVELIRKLGLENEVKYHGYKSQKEIAEIISKIDLGLVPNRLNPFTQINFPTRIFEYLTMHKPVLVPRTRGISDYFAENEILYFEPDKVEDLTAKIEWAAGHPAELKALVQSGRVICEEHSWESEEKRLLGLVANLMSD